MIEDESGVTTLDFIFALMITFGFTSVFFAVTLTLSMVEVTQYIAFSVSRSFAAAHDTPEAQIALGKAKYQELVGAGVLKKLYSSGWFTIPKAEEGPTLSSFDGEFPSQSEIDSETFTGARIEFRANLLNLRVPFLGKTATKSDTGLANISSYVGREVTTTECREKFNRQRFGAIQSLLGYKIPSGEPQYRLITDNGC
jgi:hypothetical protein